MEKSKKDIPPEALPEVDAHMRKEFRYLMLIQFLLGARIEEVSAISDQTFRSSKSIWIIAVMTFLFGLLVDQRSFLML